MHCAECDRLSKAEIEATRRAAAAQSALDDYSPAPPYGEAAVREFGRFQREFEESRELVQSTRARREAHSQTHALTLTR